MRGLVLAAAVAAVLVAPVLAQTPGAPAPAAVGPNTWTVDTGHSAAGFSVKHLLVSTVRGTLGPVKGTVEYDGKSLDSVKADITIDVNGVNTGNEGRDKDLKSPNFFDVAQFPTATFKSKRAIADGAGKFKLIGDLTIHGVTRPITLELDGTLDGGTFKGSAKTELKITDFGMKVPTLAILLRVEDRVRTQLDLVATEQR